MFWKKLFVFAALIGLFGQVRLADSKEFSSVDSRSFVLENYEKIRVLREQNNVSGAGLVRHELLEKTDSEGLTQLTFNWVPPKGGYEANARYELAGAVEELKKLSSSRPFATMARKIALKLLSLDYVKLLRAAVLGEDHTVELVENMAPLVVLSTTFILLAIIVPISGIFYSCCVNCCPCSCAKSRKHTLYADAKKQKQCCGIANATVSTVSVIVLITFSGTIFGIADQFPREDPLVLVVAQAVLKDTNEFIRLLFQNMETLVIKDVDFALGAMSLSVDNMVEHVLQPTFTELKPEITNIDSGLSAFITGMATTDKYKVETDDIVTGILDTFYLIINETNKIIKDIREQGKKEEACKNSLPQSDCSIMTRTVAALKTIPPVDFSVNITGTISSILDAIRKQDVEGSAELGKDANTMMADKVGKATKNIQADAKAAFMVVKDKLQPLVDNMTNTFSNFSDQLSEYQEYLSTQQKNYLPMRNYVMLCIAGLSGIIFLLAVTYAMGMILGITSCSSNLPDKRTTVGDFGGRLLRMSVNLSYFYVIFFLFFGGVLMLLGGFLTVLCNDTFHSYKSIQALDDPATFYGKSYIGELFLSSETSVLRMEDVLESCKNNNTAAYTVLMLDELYDIEKQVDVRNELPNKDVLNQKVSEALMSISVFSDQDNRALKNVVKDSREKLKNLDLRSFDQTLQEMLNGVADAIQAVEATIITVAITPLEEANIGRSVMYRFEWEDLRKRLQNEDENITKLFVKVKEELQPLVIKLETEVDQNMLGSAEVVRRDLQRIEEFLTNGSAKSSLTKGLNHFVAMETGLSDSLLDHVSDALRTDMARCEIFWNLFEALGVLTCDVFLHYLNPLWLSLAIMGSFLILGMWTAANLSRYFLLPDDMVDHTDKYFDVQELPDGIKPLLPYMAYPEEWLIPHEPIMFESRRDMKNNMV